MIKIQTLKEKNEEEKKLKVTNISSLYYQFFNLKIIFILKIQGFIDMDEGVSAIVIYK